MAVTSLRSRPRSRAARAASARVLALAAPFAMTLAVFVFGACDAKSSLVGPGGECFLASDCLPGLVCVEQANQSRICTDDLSRVAGEAPPEAGAMDADPDAGEGGDATDDVQTVEAGPDTNVPDTNVPDTNVQDAPTDG